MTGVTAVDALALDGMVRAEARLRADGHWTSAPRGLMDVLGKARDEVANCRVLAWALDPLARHGAGSALVGDLMLHLGLDIDPGASAVVETEIARSHSRADIVVSTGTATVIIEAKVDAAEGLDQCARLERDWPGAERFIFLTSGSERSPVSTTNRDRWTTITWSWFTDALARRLDVGAMSGDLEARLALDVWLASVKRRLS